MRRLVWSAEARSDLLELIDYIATRNPDAAKRMLALIEHSAEQIRAHPLAYRKGREEGTREAVIHPNYIMVYSMDEACVRILAVLHARQQYP